MNRSYILACFAYETNGDWQLIKEKILSNSTNKNYYINENYITIFDKEYPSKLRELQYPPWVIFYKGNLELMNKASISIVGSREVSAYGEYCTKEISKGLMQDYVLVSGMAKGVDKIVHDCCIGNGQTIAILGSGFDNVYPKCNINLFNDLARDHLVISEYPKHVAPKRHHFPWRNRLIAALGDACIVTQARFKSGTMITVDATLELSKDVYCVPYNINDINGEGCNLLISQGANIIIDFKNIL